MERDRCGSLSNENLACKIMLYLSWILAVMLQLNVEQVPAVVFFGTKSASELRKLAKDIFSNLRMSNRFIDLSRRHANQNASIVIVKDFLHDKIVGLASIYLLDVEKDMQEPLKHLMPVKRCFWFDFLGVHSEYRHQGIASKFLLPFVQKHYDQTKDDEIPCFTVCREDNIVSLKALRKHFRDLATFFNAESTKYILLGPPEFTETGKQIGW